MPTAMLANACCRCMWPLIGRSGRGFPDPKGEEGRSEEEERLLDSVLESDDEQADPLSADQIKRYLDESRARSEEECEAFDDQEPDRRCGRSYPQPQGHRGRPAQLHMTPTRQNSSAPLVDEYDELFDEEFEDEPENVVVGAKPGAGGASRSTGGPLLELDRPEANAWQRDGSLVDWVDMVDEELSPSQHVSMEAFGVLPHVAALPSFSERPLDGTSTCSNGIVGDEQVGGAVHEGIASMATGLSTSSTPGGQWAQDLSWGAHQPPGIALGVPGGAMGVETAKDAVVRNGAMQKLSIGFEFDPADEDL